MRVHLLTILALLGTPLSLATAQTRDERAFTALRASPLGSLTPLLTPAMLSRRPNGAQLGIRYALRDEHGPPGVVRSHPGPFLVERRLRLGHDPPSGVVAVPAVVEPGEPAVTERKQEVLEGLGCLFGD